jgi:two-component system nitrate/nitrite response regulator NarL
MAIRVLIVEDNAVARKFLVRVVRESFSDEIIFSEAADCETARRLLGLAPDGGVTRIKDDPYRLILCDLEQPQGGGIELLAELTHYPATKIATTLHSDDEHLFPALQYGANGYLLKEDRFEVLVEELQKVVRGQPPLSPAMARRLLGFFKAQASHTPRTSRASADTAAVSGFAPFNEIPSGFGAVDTAPEPCLNPRENEVLSYLSKGFTLKEVARHMGIKWFAVNDHIRSVYGKLSRLNAAGHPAGAAARHLST